MSRVLSFLICKLVFTLHSFSRCILKEHVNCDETRFHNDTFAFKYAVVQNFLLIHPQITAIRVWDDRINHIELFEKKLTGLINEKRLESFSTNLVTHAIHERKFIVDHDLERELVTKLISNVNNERESSI